MAEFTSIPTTDAPHGQRMLDPSPLDHATGVSIMQKVEMLEAAATTAGCGCVETPNTYKVFDKDSGAPIFIVQEDSNMCYRCCCKPSHAATLHFHQTHDGKDKGPVIMEAEKPCKCCCIAFACMDLCREEITLRKGAGEGGPTIGSIKEACCGGFGCKPTYEVNNSQGAKEGAIVGPCCVIGDCCDTTFMYSNNDGQAQSPIEKQGVDGMKDALKELATDADNFTLTFGDPNMTPEQKATLVAGTLLIDYMFYEGDGSFQCNPLEKSCSITCCQMYCCGWIQPCKCKCDCSGEDGGAE